MGGERVERVVLQPRTRTSLQQGIRTMVNAVRPTLGPLPRVVAMQQVIHERMPEMLDDGGVIARRIIQIANRDEDMGAMLVRQLLWRLHEEVGDGTATSAVILQSVYDQGLHFLTSGGNSMLLRRHLEKGLRIILNELDRMSNPVEGREALTQVAESICYDEPLARLLGEIFDIVGEYGHIEVRSARGRENEREYVEGMYWKSKIVSREFLTDTARYRTELEDAAILISDVQVGDPRELVPAIAATHKAGLNALLILAKSLSEEATNFLLTTNKKHEDFQVVATKIPGYTSSQQIDAMQDLAILTGGKPFASMGGEKIDRLRFDDLGRAKRAWIDRFNMGIIAGQGDPRAIRQHLANLRSAFRTTNDAEVRKTLQERIGKIMGGSATLWVGGASETDIDQKKELAKRTAEAMRGAVHEGVVPGAGVALLECRPALRDAMEEAEGLEERAAYRILIRALEEPARTIMANAGYNVEEVMAQLKLAGSGHGFDVRKGELVDIREAGLVDVTTVQKEAVRGGVESAALALTVDVLIHRKEPPESVSP